MRISEQHRLDVARWVASPNFDERPPGATPELIVLHCVSLPEDEFGTGAPSRLFADCLDPAEHPSFHDLAGVHVAPHLLLDRGGAVEQFVTLDKRAWHAGQSCWRGRALCNDYSIGIELEGSIHQPYTSAQYETLAAVVRALLQKYPGLSPDAIVGHAEIAPGRKEDPGPHFDWARLFARVHDRAALAKVYN